MSATDTNVKPPIENNLTRLSYYQINPSYTVRVICCVLFIFLTEICLSHYIYRLINAEIREEYVSKRDVQQNFVNFVRSELGRNEINKLLKDFEREDANSRNTRRKRGTLDDNQLNMPSDGPNVEFFNPKLRGELEAKDEKQRQLTGNKGAAPGGDTWVWLTSYSRIPVRAF